eukprot:4938079-Pyramimonas_sp.AAC.1
MSFGVPGTPTGRILMLPGTGRPQQEGARVLCHALSQVYMTRTVTSQCHMSEAHKFDETEFSNPDDYKDRVRFLGNKDRHYQHERRQGLEKRT